MASKTVIRRYADGTSKEYRRKKQGRKPAGLAKAQLVRLYSDSKEQMNRLADVYGYCWNENEFIRDAVREKLSNSIYIELYKS
jgi:hypothetical protein